MTTTPAQPPHGQAYVVLPAILLLGMLIVAAPPQVAVVLRGRPAAEADDEAFTR